MRKNYIFLILIVLAYTLFICSGCSNSISRKNMEANQKNNDIAQSAPAGATEKASAPGDNQNLESGPADSVPWESDSGFLSAQEKAGTPVRMAAFKTVLHDPLPGEEQNVHLAARILAGTIVKPGQVFSQNRAIGPYTSDRGFQKGPMYLGLQLVTTTGGGVCKMASTLYNVAVLCNLPILERYAHGMPVPYVPYGQDATVAYGDKDIQFKNNLSYPLLIWAQGVDNTLYVAFYGQSQPPQVEWHHEILYTSKAPKLYRFNQKLSPGEEKVIVEGMDGAGVKSWVTVTNTDGTTTVKQLSGSYYSPMPYIIEKNTVAATSQ